MRRRAAAVAAWLLLAALAALLPHAQANAKPAIVNGRVADGPGRYTWMASLQANFKLEGEPDQWGHVCGGALIDIGKGLVVITAAHCVGDEYSFIKPGDRVVIGGWSTQDLYPEQGGPPSGADVRRVARTVVHPGYDADNGDAPNNDIALLVLDQPSRKTAIRTPPYTQKPSLPVPPGTMLDVIGWGLTRKEPPADPTVLRQVALQLQPLQTCQSVLGARMIIEPPFTSPANTMICAGNPPAFNEGSCNGDSGGPSFVKGETAAEDLLIGLVSWGVGEDPCIHHPKGQTNVAQLMKWVADAVRQQLAQRPLVPVAPGKVLDGGRASGFEGQQLRYPVDPRARPGSWMDILSGPSLSAGRPFKFLGRLGQVGAGGPVHVDAARLSWSKAPIASSQELVTLAATPTGLAVSVSGRGAVRGGGTLPLADLGRLQYGRGGTVTITKPGFVFTARQPALVPRYGRPRFAPHLLLEVRITEKRLSGQQAQQLTGLLGAGSRWL